MDLFNKTTRSLAQSTYWIRLHIFFIITIAFSTRNGLPQTADELFFDDMDSYIAGGQLVCQNQVDWKLWSQPPCDPVQDPFISSTYSFSGPNSCLIAPNNDLIKLLGLKTSGKWYINFIYHLANLDILIHL